jgi:type IV pilus assembly protein PilV
MRRRLARESRGGFLLEALVALLIFSFGVLAMVGLHARAVRHFNEAQYRANAAELVHGTLAAMHATDPATLASRFDRSTGGPGWLALLDQAKRLPGVDDTQNVPMLEIADGPTAGSRQVSLDVFWQTPDNDQIHRYAATGVVGAN